jgi:hypothetical protein
LAEVISTNPVWWTATAKAKAIAGIVLALRFAHSLGLIHGHLNSNHIHFDVDVNDRIEITDFYLIDHEVAANEKDTDVLSSEGWSLDSDIRGFVSILIEIILGDPVILPGVEQSEVTLSRDIPVFVSELIESGQSREWRMGHSLNDIFEVLKHNDFEIVSGVDSADVLGVR